MDFILGGNPLELLARYRHVNEWFLMDEVDRWARGEEGAEREALGRQWGDIVARRLKWRLIYSSYIESRDLDAGLVALTREQFAAQIREQLPEALRSTEFEVDIASQGTKAFNPLTEETDVVLYDPLDGRYERNRVIDLFRRLPVRISLCRIFARDDAHRDELIAAADRALSPG
jgi:hypothetical protein